MHRSETSHRLSMIPERHTGNMPRGAGHSRGQLQDIRNISIAPSRFTTGKTGPKGKTVRLPGKKDGEKKTVFAQRGNVGTYADANQNPKRLKTMDSSAAECSEIQVTGKAATSNPFVRVTGNQRMSNGQEAKNGKTCTVATYKSEPKEAAPKQSKSGKKQKVRLPMPNIPIPVPLPPHVIAERRLARIEINNLTSEVDGLLQDIPPNAHSIGLQDEWFGNTDVIYRNLRLEDDIYVLSPASLCAGSEVKPETRRILIDWIIQVQTYLNLHNSTLHLTTRMLDQFISRRKVVLTRYQLVGVTCLFIAAKYEERFPPSLEKLVHLTDNTYTEDEIIQMERMILCELEFKIHFPFAPEYLDYFLCAVPVTDVLEQNADRVRNLCLYLLDLTLPEIHMVQWPTYVVTAATMCLATKIVAQYYEPEYSEYDGNDGDDAQHDTQYDAQCNAQYDDQHDAQYDVQYDEPMSGMSITSPNQDTRCALCQSLNVQCIPDSVLVHYTGSREERLLPVMQRIAKILRRADTSPHQAAAQKYRSHTKYNNISEWPGLNTPLVDDIIDVQPYH